MPQVVTQDIDQLTRKISITVERDDYEPKLLSELKRYRKDAEMKGFRKGKVPVSIIKKMYGRPILSEVINGKLQEELSGLIQKEELDLIGQPIPAQDQADVDLDPDDLQDYTFHFEVGMAPDFNLQGLDEQNTFEKYKVEVKTETIDEEIERLKKQHGERITSESEIEEEDILKLEGTEQGPITEPYTTEFTLYLPSISDKYRADFAKATVGDELDVNLNELEPDIKEAYVRKHYLNLQDDDEREVSMQFTVKIKEASRIKPAELNQELFDKVFGEGEVSSEEELRSKIEEAISEQYEQHAEALLYRDFQEDLLHRHELSLPDEFLKRWLVMSDEKTTPELVEEQYDRFSENLRWTLIRNKLQEHFDVSVGDEELKEHLRAQVAGYLAQSGMSSEMMGPDFLEGMVERMMSDENQTRQAHDQILENKLHDKIADVVTIKDKLVAEDEFSEIMAKARAEAEARNNPQGGKQSAAEEE